MEQICPQCNTKISEDEDTYYIHEINKKVCQGCFDEFENCSLDWMIDETEEEYFDHED